MVRVLACGERGDIIKTMYRTLVGRGLRCGSEDYAIHQAAEAGRAVAKPREVDKAVAEIARGSVGLYEPAIRDPGFRRDVQKALACHERLGKAKWPAFKPVPLRPVGLS